MREFAAHGFEAASMNMICQDGGISKGNLYHYYPSKGALYLECVRRCFEELTEGLRIRLGLGETLEISRVQSKFRKVIRMGPESGELGEEAARRSGDGQDNSRGGIHNDGEGLLRSYFDARVQYFREHPVSAMLFCRCMDVPDMEMKKRLFALRADFDALNREVITRVLEAGKLRRDMSNEEAVELFRMLEEMWNNENFNQPEETETMKRREYYCRRMIDVFFYGILAREAE